MEKSYLLLAIVFVLLFIGCNTPQAEYDPYIIKDLSTAQKSDFIKLKDDRLMIIKFIDIACEAKKPTACQMTLADETGHNWGAYPIELWAPQVEKITHYADPTWKMIAKKYLDNH